MAPRDLSGVTKGIECMHACLYGSGAAASTMLWRWNDNMLDTATYTKAWDYIMQTILSGLRLTEYAVGLNFPLFHNKYRMRIE